MSVKRMGLMRAGLQAALTMVFCFVGMVGVGDGHALALDSGVRKVTVGGYQFEPFVDGTSGVSPDLIALLNQSQSDVRFDFVLIPAQRRYERMQSGKIDMLMFEMAAWGWQDKAVPVETTAPLLSGHEAFVARRDRWDTALPPEDRLTRKLALTLGYHYAFAGFNADQKYLKSHYDVVFAETQTKVLKHLLAGNADIAIVSDLFLTTAMIKDPSIDRVVVTVSPPDQLYDLPLMVRKSAPVTAAELGKMLKALKKDSKLQQFFAVRGLGDFLVY